MRSALTLAVAHNKASARMRNRVMVLMLRSGENSWGVGVMIGAQNGKAALMKKRPSQPTLLESALAPSPL